MKLDYWEYWSTNPDNEPLSPSYYGYCDNCLKSYEVSPKEGGCKCELTLTDKLYFFKEFLAKGKHEKQN